MATTSILMGTAAGLDVLGGLFNMDAAEEEAKALKSQAALVRAESDADAERYSISASRFKATQKVAYLKSGVELSGTPLDVLDETARVSRENLSAMRAESAAKEQRLKSEASRVKNAGRAAFIQGIAGAASIYAKFAPTSPGPGRVAKKGPTTTASSGSKTNNKSARLNLITGF